MEFFKTLLAALVATSAMTLFSYIISASFRKLYKEPMLLQFLMASLRLELSQSQKVAASWLLHYLIGWLFVWLYWLPLTLGLQWYQVSLISGLGFGILFGLLGIAGWELMFRYTPGRAPVNKKGYYGQLFMAHLIFGVSMAGVLLVFDYL